MNMSKSEAGRLGAVKTNEIIKDRWEKIRSEYEKNPNLCSACSSPLPYKKRNYKFCSRSCSSSVNNVLHPKRKPTTPRFEVCLCCGKKLSNPQSRFCSNKCCGLHRFWTETVPRVELGLVDDRVTLRKYLFHMRGHACEQCRQSDWESQPMPLEVDHIDGDAGNNHPDNLRLLCPNCHALQPTSKGRNRGRGRKARGLQRG